MKIKVLDGLRGYAALMIVLAHAPKVSESELFQSILTFTSKTGMGYLGVDIFFVLSGFLITRILIKEKNENNFSFKRFYIKRSLRIFPIYYLTVIICGIVFTWDGILYTSTYLSNYYFSFNSIEPHPLKHTWSLAIEEHYYFLWPLVIYFFTLEKIKKYYLPIIYVTIIISLFFVFSYFDSITANLLVLKATNFRILSISIGSIFAFYEQRFLPTFKKQTLIKLFVIFIVFYSLALTRKGTVLIDILPESVLLLFLYSVTSSSLFLLVLSYENSKSLINKLFTNKTIIFIGKISYGIYLFHYPIFYYFTDNHQNVEGITLSKYIFAMFLTFVVPITSYYLIERPLIKYKNKLITSKK